MKRRLKIGGRGCLCKTCGEYFSGIQPFDEHRKGTYTQLPPQYGRSCRSPEEMIARGMAQNARGEWMGRTGALEAA